MQCKSAVLNQMYCIDAHLSTNKHCNAASPSKKTFCFRVSEVYHALFLNPMLSNAEFIDMTVRTTLIAVRTVLYAIYATTVYHKEALYRSATTILR